jgi:hypothetical protein
MRFSGLAATTIALPQYMSAPKEFDLRSGALE